MIEHHKCRSEGHDMRPMNGMGGRVCRRCGFFLPFDDEGDDTPVPEMRVLVYALAAAALAALGFIILI